MEQPRVLEKYARQVQREVPDVRKYLKGATFEDTEFFSRLQNFRRRETSDEAKQKAIVYQLGGFVLWGQFKLMDEGLMK